VENVTENYLRDQLLERRHRLEAVLPGTSEHAQLTQLLTEVDSALERMDKGSYGICEVCHDPVEKDRLLADPLVRYCLDHLTESGRRALEQDLELAAQMQHALLPKQNLRHNGWEVAFHYAPHGPVSGDYCDVILPDGDSSLFFALGDAAGKGVAASMMTAHLHAIFRTLMSSKLPVHQMVEQASRIFCESTMSPYFATLVCGRGTARGEIELSNAGHCRPLLIRHGEVTRLESGGLPLGLFCEGRYTSESLRLDHGDSLLLYTDGLVESSSSAGEEFGDQRVAEAAARFHSLPPGKFIDGMLEAHGRFCRGERATDDLSMMVIRRQV
jgi:sigma-B regulation protein RsbU (phosphoserine phosphatase)